jgi:hypothetical protein
VGLESPFLEMLGCDSAFSPNASYSRTSMIQLTGAVLLREDDNFRVGPFVARLLSWFHPGSEPFVIRSLTHPRRNHPR